MASAKVAFSILSADLSKTADDIIRMDQAGVDLFHIDIMDGHFVPNLTFGMGMVKALRQHTKLPFDVHLMVDNPENYVEKAIEAGANYITVHAEAVKHLDRILNSIKSQAGVKAGVALNPGTPISMVEEVLYVADLVLIMSVNPGFGGQKFIESMVDKISRLKQIIAKNNYKVQIEVDGGVNTENAAKIKDAGAEILVVGSALTGKIDLLSTIKDLQR